MPNTTYTIFTISKGNKYTYTRRRYIEYAMQYNFNVPMILADKKFYKICYKKWKIQ